MKAYDQGSSFFWLIFSICVLIESLRLGIGKHSDPGMGFMSFGASGLLGILSLIQVIQTSFKKEETKIAPLFLGTMWGRVFLVIIALLIYSRLMPIAGYLISTFLLMSFLFWIVKGQKWWWILISSFLTTIISYYLFSKWLNCQFPEGFFGL
jgi:hypothetical protein